MSQTKSDCVDYSESEDIETNSDETLIGLKLTKPRIINVPEDMFEYIGPAENSPNMSLYKCLLTNCPINRTGKKYISSSKTSRNNIRRHVKVIRIQKSSIYNKITCTWSLLLFRPFTHQIWKYLTVKLIYWIQRRGMQ